MSVILVVISQLPGCSEVAAAEQATMQRHGRRQQCESFHGDLPVSGRCRTRGLGRDCVGNRRDRQSATLRVRAPRDHIGEHGDPDPHQPRGAGDRPGLRPPPPGAARQGRGRQGVQARLRLSAGGRSAAGDRRAGRADPRRREDPGAARRHRLGQDLYRRPGDRDAAAPGAGARARTRSSPPSSTGSSRASSPTMRSSSSSPITIITSPRPMCRAPTPTSRRKAR